MATNANPRATRVARVVAGAPESSAHRFTRINAFVIYKAAQTQTITRYAAQLQDLLPIGKAWTRAPATNLTRLLIGMAVEFDRVDSRVQDLFREMNPGTAGEMLPDWERNLGLPDACAPVVSSIAERQAAALARYASRGESQSASKVTSIESIATNLGISSALVRRFHLDPFDCESDCDDALNDEFAPLWWEIEATHVSAEIDAFLECQVVRAMLSDRQYVFAHPLVMMGEMTFTRSGTATFVDPNDDNESTVADGEIGAAYVGI